jgi:hypothetical protein
VFWLPPLVWYIPHSKKNPATYCHKCTQVFTWSTRFSCQVLIKLTTLEFSQQIFKKYSNIEFHQKPFSGGPDVPYDGQTQTDGQSDMMKLIIAFRNLVKSPKKSGLVFITTKECIYCAVRTKSQIYLKLTLVCKELVHVILKRQSFFLQEQNTQLQ